MTKRRAAGEGSIRKRSDGRWEGRYVAGHDENGKPIRKNVLGKTQAEVVRKLREALVNVKTENVPISHSEEFTLVEWLKRWVEEYGQAYLRASSLVNYTGFLNNQIKNNSIGTKKLTELSSHDFQIFYNKMSKDGRVQRKESEKQAKGLAAKSIRNMHFFISHALDQAVKEKRIPENPVRDCILPKKEHTEMKTLPLKDLSAFFDEAKRSGVFELYYTELSTGLRRGELLGIRWTDIDFDASAVYIQRKITRLNGEIKISPLKTKNAYRQILLPTNLLTILREKQTRENGFSEYVFSSPTGGPMCPDSMLKMLHRVLKRAGLKEIRFHDLRHTFSVLALQNGVDVKTLSGILGHYSAGFTLDTYGHITTAMKQDAANKVGNFLASAV
jgi:integrase